MLERVPAKKPVIGIANSYTDVNPGHRAFKQLP